MRVALVALPGRGPAARATVRSAVSADPAAAVVVLAADACYRPVGPERVVDLTDVAVPDLAGARVRLAPGQLADLLGAALVCRLLQEPDHSPVLVLAAGVEVLGRLGAAERALEEHPGMPAARLVGGGAGAVVVRAGQLPWARRWLAEAADWRRTDSGPATEAEVHLPLLDLSRADPDRPWVLDPDNADPAVLLSEHPALAALVAGRLAARRADRDTSDTTEAADIRATSETTTLGFPVDPALRALWRAAPEATPPDLFDPAAAAAARNWLTDTAGEGQPPRYLAGVWASRADLQAAFPRVPGPDTAALLQWANRHARADLPHADSLIAECLEGAAKTAATRATAGSPGAATPLANAVTAATAVGAGAASRVAARAGRAAGASARAVAQRAAARGRAIRRPTPGADGAAVRVELVGFLGGDLGIGASARGVRDALVAAGVPVRTRTIRPWTGPEGPGQQVLAPRPRARRPRPGDVTIVCVNAAEIGAVAAAAGADWAGTRRIGYWYWEVEDFPATQHPAFGHVDEVWVATEFVRAALAPHSPVPVLTLPPPLWHEPAPPQLDRAALGLPPGRPIVLFTFDYLSTAERKNPWGAVAAFRLAFPRTPGSPEPGYAAGHPGGRPLLVLKSVNAQLRVADAERLRLLVADDPDVLLLERRLDAAELESLVAHCDVYLSLHRSEGLGLTVAEAMCHGKPVVTTAYGGLVDFVDDSCGYPVPWQPTAIPAGCAPYPEGGAWAEPDIAQAAHLLRQAMTDPADAHRRGATAAARLRELHNPAVAGAAMAARLTGWRPASLRPQSR